MSKTNRNYELQIDVLIEFNVFEKKTVRILNVSGLRLKNLSFLIGFSCLEQLIATDNSFEDADAITAYMSNIPTINQADLRGCPAQHDFYYRNKISSRCDSLRNYEYSSRRQAGCIILISHFSHHFLLV